ncbi:MAG: tRNA pseudouridine synthase A [candidate division WOR-3 bacterium]
MRSKVVRLEIEFDGSNYFGWQFQPNHDTVQGRLTQALTQLFGRLVTVTGVGRTDRGVSGLSYTVSFPYPVFSDKTGGRENRSSLPCPSIPITRLANAINQLLPQDIRVQRAAWAATDFNARFRARSRLYRYTIVQGRSPLLRNRAWEVTYPLDIPAINRALEFLPGRHDFACLCRIRASLRPEATIVNIIRARLRARRCALTGYRLHQFEFEADHFLKLLVRRLVGILVDVGRGIAARAGLEPQAALAQAIAGSSPIQFTTAPASGLLFVRARY